MKRLAFLLVGIFMVTSMMASLFGSDFLPAKFTFKDGRVVSCIAKKPKSCNDRTVEYKMDKKAKGNSYLTRELKMVEYTLENGTLEVYDIQKVLKGAIMQEAENQWLRVIVRGKVTLYSWVIVHPVTYTNGQSTGGGEEKYWGCIRDEEQGVKILVYLTPGGMFVIRNTNSLFKNEGALYFADNSDLAMKISDKSYTWEKIEEVVKLYNNGTDIKH